MPGAGDRLTQWLRRQWHLVVLAGWAALWFVILARHGGIAWKFFVQGTDLLFTGHDGGSVRPAGLDLFASYPQLQIGPAAYPLAQLLREIGPDNGVVAAEVLMTLMGLAVVAMIQRIVVVARPELAGLPCRMQVMTLIAGAFFVTAWQELAVGYGHLDDALALTCVVAAVWACLTGRMIACGALIGLAGASKPWAFGYLPVLALPRLSAPTRRSARTRPSVRASPSVQIPSSVQTPSAVQTPPSVQIPSAVQTSSSVQTSPSARIRLVPGPPWSVAELRARLPALASLAIVTLAAWLPFFAADSATVNAMHYKIANMPDSALRALGVAAASTPSWDRPAQVIIGCVLGAIAVARGRWAAVILLSAGARIALDPGVHSYYTPEVMAGALLWDLLGARRPLPAWTMISFGALNLAPLLTKDATVLGELRLWLVIAFTVTVLLAPASWYWNPPGWHPSGWRPPRWRTASRPDHPSHPGQQPAPDPLGPAAAAARVAAARVAAVLGAGMALLVTGPAAPLDTASVYSAAPAG